MRRHFEGRTKYEALALADAWWRTQAGVTAILRVAWPVDDVAHPTKWEVVVHYRRAGTAPSPLRANGFLAVRNDQPAARPVSGRKDQRRVESLRCASAGITPEPAREEENA